jgi:hypothetical protein
VFYFQQLLNIALSGIDATAVIGTVTNIAYGILLIGFLIGLYNAVIRGGDVRALGVTAIKYLAVAIIIANWSTAFRDVNNSFNSVAQFIGNSSGAGDMFLSWMDQLAKQFTNSGVSFWDIITGDIAALIGALLIVVAYLLYVVALVLFSFFYVLYGSILYVLGPMILALLPMPGVGQLGKSFATNLMIWNAWGVIYATFCALLTAIQVNQVTQAGGGGFLGFLRGPVDSLILGLVSIFLAISIALIPFIAKRVISGDVGSTAMSMVRAGAAIAGVALAGGAGLAAGASGGSAGAGGASSTGSGAGVGAGAGTGAGASGNAASTTASSSSSMPPRTPCVGQSIHSGLAGVLSSGTGPKSSAAAGATFTVTRPGQVLLSSGSSNGGATSGQSTGGSSGSGSSGSGRSGPRSNSSSSGYRPRGVAQQLAYQTARALGKAVGRNKPEDN